MKLATYRRADDTDRLGIVLKNDSQILDVGAAHELETGTLSPFFYSLQAFIIISGKNILKNILSTDPLSGFSGVAISKKA